MVNLLSVKALCFDSSDCHVSCAQYLTINFAVISLQVNGLQVLAAMADKVTNSCAVMPTQYCNVVGLYVDACWQSQQQHLPYSDSTAPDMHVPAGPAAAVEESSLETGAQVHKGGACAQPAA